MMNIARRVHLSVARLGLAANAVFVACATPDPKAEGARPWIEIAHLPGEV
jgi:hypothetical protein